MSEFLFNKARSVAITGHRNMKSGFDKENLTDIFYQLIDKGFDTFYIGMALGFDTLCFQILEKIREEKNIKLIACIPCPTQAEKFSLEQKREYDRMVLSADEKVIISKKYTNNCMQKRNEYMVDNATVLVAYLRRSYGGTQNTVEYARKNHVLLLYV